MGGLATLLRRVESNHTTGPKDHIRQKASRQVSARRTIAIVSAPIRGAVGSVRRAGQRAYPLCRYLLRPRALELVGLMVAVALWGFGYKLSLYSLHPTDAQRTTVAKLWVEGDDSLAAAKRLKSQSQLAAGPQAICSPISWLPGLDRAAVCFLPGQRCGILSVDSSILPRSPPPAELHKA